MDLIDFDPEPSNVALQPPQPGPPGISPSPVSPGGENLDNRNLEEEEIDERTPEEIMNDIEEIDEEMLSVRENPNLSDEQKLEQINDLMEKRNEHSDKLQERRNSEFKAFVESLNLAQIHVTPFFPAPRRCKLQVHNEAANELLKAPTVESQKKWGKGLFKKKTDDDNNSHDTEIQNLSRIQKGYNSQRIDKLQKELATLTKKKYLSPDDMATKLRIKAELSEFERFCGVKIQKK